MYKENGERRTNLSQEKSIKYAENKMAEMCVYICVCVFVCMCTNHAQLFPGF